ncbi:MAG: PaaI family thioesterase [Lachnospiraceae bacterium]|nr:PaaI family thioesterase [Lachnospiraceae bacterium]
MTDDELYVSGLLKQNTYAVRSGVQMGWIRGENACLTMDVSENILNLYGMVHGGAYFTLADCCAGVVSRMDRRHYVTQHADVSFFRPIKTGRLIAIGSLIHRGSKTCTVEVYISDENEKRLFHSTFTFFCIDKD